MIDKKLLVIEKRNSEAFLRSRFTVDLVDNSDEILNRFSKELKTADCNFLGKIVDGHIFISVLKKDEHFWSPQLHLEIISKADTTSLLKGLFGPKPQVWTLFMFIHFVIGISFLGFCVMLFTRISLDGSLVFPIIMMVALPFLWIVLYFLGQIGKDTGKKQMIALHDFMLKVI